MDNSLFYIIYKTTNIINNKFYIGKHQTREINDAYLGSGRAILRAIKKYGRKNFKREVLFVFDNEREMNEKEIELITEDFVKSNLNYNSAVGGEGGPHFKGRNHSQGTKKILSNKATGRTFKKTKDHLDRERLSRYEKNNGKFFSVETIKKMSNKKKDLLRDSKEREKISLGLKIHYKKGLDRGHLKYKRTKETKAKMSAVMKNTYAERYKNLIWIKNKTTGACIRIAKDSFPEYRLLGFEMGRILKAGD